MQIMLFQKFKELGATEGEEKLKTEDPLLIKISLGQTEGRLVKFGHSLYAGWSTASSSSKLALLPKVRNGMVE